MNLPCGCCHGIETRTPHVPMNRPGLSRLTRRVGTHGTFLESMKARLSSSDFPELEGLRTREGSDPAIAVLDSWATVADVLSFYQERLINEGFLRTATERRSVLELARLVGYSLRPGISASVYLAYALEKGFSAEIPSGARAQSVPGPGELPQSFETSDSLSARDTWNAIPPRLARPHSIKSNGVNLNTDTFFLAGTSSNLKPNDPLLFEFKNGNPVVRHVESVDVQFSKNRTKVKLQEKPYTDADAAWRVRASRAALANLVRSPKLRGEAKAQVRSLLSFLARDVEPGRLLRQPLHPQLRGLLIGDFASSGLVRRGAAPEIALEPSFIIQPGGLLSSLLQPPSRQPASRADLRRDIKQVFDSKSDMGPQLLVDFHPALRTTLYTAWRGAKADPAQAELQAVYALRVTASLFGHNAPQRTQVNPRTGEVRTIGEWPVVELKTVGESTQAFLREKVDVVDLEGSHSSILPGSWVVVKTTATEPVSLTTTQIITAKAASPRPNVARADYGVSGKVTRVTLISAGGSPVNWITADLNKVAEEYIERKSSQELLDKDFQIIRQTVVHAGSERLTLADEDLSDEDVTGDTLELDGLYDGLQSGRWMIVSGERTDIIDSAGAAVTGVTASELVMISGVVQDTQKTTDTRGDKVDLPGDTVHTVVTLANELAYSYKRETVKIYANVVKATHGETRSEVLGGGDPSRTLQQFTLRQSPLTYRSAPTPGGAQSTLEIRVNDVLWHESDGLSALGPRDCRYVARTDDDGKTTVVFGNGQQGTLPASGMENIKAVYRSGIGKAGNVDAERITLLTTKPLGVKEVINPLPATGGADRETRDQARQSVPKSTRALERLVSVKDYEDFARTYAGIGKASAVRMPDGHRQLVHVTIAGVDDIPIDMHSDLFRNLRHALHQFGNPYQPVALMVREVSRLLVSANVAVLPNYQWPSVEPRIRATMLDVFSFQRRELGQNLFLSEVIRTMQQVEGVAYVDVDVIEGLSSEDAADLERLAQRLRGALMARQPKKCVTAELASPFRRAGDGSAWPPGTLRPAQLVYLSPTVPDTLILQEVLR